MSTSDPAPSDALPLSFTPVDEAPAWRFMGIKIHQRIRTGQKHIGWSSVFIVSLIWFTFGFHIFAGGQALTFTVQKYTKDPRLISLVTTLNVIIMLGPFVSYISDQVWTRVGRRRPFLITSWAAATAAMFSFAFMPQVSGMINAVLALVGIPPVADFMLLICIIVSYTTLYDLTAPLEPLFLECVPPHQRGRFFAIRSMLLSLAIMTFYQGLWPVFDVQVDMFSYLGFPETLSLTGEQLIYILGGSLFFITGGFLLFNIEEVKTVTAPNKRFRDLGMVRFVKSYVKDVFLDKRNYAFYIVLVIPAMEQMVWGNFGALMQNDQFQYSKQNQADWAFPVGLIGMWILTPLSGFYSDSHKRIRGLWRILIGLAGVAGALGVWYGYTHWAPPDIRELPSMYYCTAIALMSAIGCTGFLVFMVESLLDFVGHLHVRAWVSLLAILLGLATNIGLYCCIKFSSEGVIPITGWMIFGAMGSAWGALLGSFLAPMIYEYMPRSRMGTINAGRGIYGDSLKFGIANLGAWWVWFYSTRFYRPANSAYDYTSMYLLQFILYVPAILATIWFIRQIHAGRILRWGIIEVEGEEPADDAKAPPAELDQAPVS